MPYYQTTHLFTKRSVEDSVSSEPFKQTYSAAEHSTKRDIFTKYNGPAPLHNVSGNISRRGKEDGNSSSWDMLTITPEK